MSKVENSEWATVSELLAPSKGEEEVFLKTLQKKVTIQKVTVGDLAIIMKNAKDNDIEQYIWLVFKGLKKPQLTIEQVRKLPLKVIVELSAAIARFSELDRKSVEGVRNLLESEF